MTKSFRAFLSLAPICLCVGLVAQTTTSGRPIRLVPPSATASGRIPPELQALLDAAQANQAGAAVNTAGVSAAAANPGAALQKIQRLQFDRRPSTILQAWSRAEPEPFKEESEAAEATPPAPAGDKPPTEAPPPETAATETAPPPPAPTADPAAAAAAAAAAKEKARAERRLTYDLGLFERNVTLGRWDRVGAFLMTLPDAERRPAYEYLLGNLGNPQFLQQGNNRIPTNLRENNAFDFADVLGLAAAAPAVPPKPPAANAPPPTEPAPVDADRNLQRNHIQMLAAIVRRALDGGYALEEWIASLRRQAGLAATERVFTRRLGALMLAAIGQDVELLPFLPTLDEAVAADDREALNLIARHALAMHQKEEMPVHLERAWRATQAVLAAGKVRDADKAEGLRRAVELAPRIRSELGEAWLAESFAVRPERGMEVLATIGTFAAQGMQQRTHDTKFRQKSLELQKTAVDALLRAAPARAQEWREVLNLLAANWIDEANYAYGNSEADSMTPYLQRDAYGNIFYQSFNQRQNLPVQPMAPADLLPTRPTGAWEELIDAGRRPTFVAVLAQLYLKVNDEDQAFPLIETLATSHAVRAKTLAEEFLRVWARNHNPNQTNQRTNQYMFMYGFDQRANAIPLTRSKQERNLAELAALAVRLRALPIGGLDEQLLVDAFTQCHSTAEVYRLEAVEKVFGALDALSPKTLTSLAQRMRTNLASVWRRPNVQENAKTKRNQKDIEREVLAGYETAGAVVARARQKHAEHWGLLMAQASLEHDENNFRQEVAKSSEFAGKRLAALGKLAAAAASYATGVEALPADEWTTDAFDTWFYAALGACDLAAVSDENALANSQPAAIRAALEALSGEAGEKHRAMFANNLFTRLSAVRPQVKSRYLRAGFDIVGDHPRAAEARKVFEYYNDLVHEIRLVAHVDGDAAVGADRPFGVRVDLLHTREIERESGGFAKYLQNQNNAQFAYNYGRPTENYRDKFQEAAAQALQEHFEILSVTFNAEDVRSKATDDYGWRVTPYAYLLLKARGPQVDKVPALRLDLDFLDTSGYAVLPIESAPIVVDASVAAPGPRPCTNVEVTQILDERKAAEGKLVLEIKASADGLVPDLDQLLDLHADGFVVVKRDDQGLAVSEFADDREHVRSERLWLVTLKAAEGAAPPTRFRFASAKREDTKLVHQRYVDADLATVGAEIDLERRYDDRGFPWLWTLLGVLAVALGFFGWRRALRGRGEGAVARWRVPEPATPFAVLGLLREIQSGNGLDASAHAELDAEIVRVERQYFAPTPGEPLDLAAIAQEWVRKAR